MRDNMYEGIWSPFDPEWYQQAFDKFVSTADELFNKDEIIAAGYDLPDADGSKSSVFHQDAVTNNSFDENVLRDTLRDIYLNSTNRLMAANHDNSHFFKWAGTMKDAKLIANTAYCEVTIPTDSFISPSSRNSYKFKQFYRQWVPITDLLNNWDTFKFTCLLFINQKIYSEYELRMDDQETVIRFKYYDHWIDNDYTIYIYKFDTNAQCRVKVSKELIVNQWDWKMPISYIDDQRVLNSDHVMAAFNKISDMNIRTDGVEIADVMGDNLEFLKIENGYIDLKKCSAYNRHLLVTESDQWIWMSIIVPKFMHEFPILLPTDVIYRPYIPRYEQVKVRQNGAWANVRTTVTDEKKNVFINMNDVPSTLSYYLNDDGELIIEYQGNDDIPDLSIDDNGYLILNSNHNGIDIELTKYFFREDNNGDLNVFYSWNDGWKYTIRPLVLSDAYDIQDINIYDQISEDMENLRQLTIEEADLIEKFRNFITLEYTTDEEFLDKLQELTDKIDHTHDVYAQYRKDRRMDIDTDYESVWEEYHEVIEDIKSSSNKFYAIDRFYKQHTKYRDFWAFISPLVYLPREFADIYEISIITARIGNETFWEDKDRFKSQIRFRRPIEEDDFWTFEFYEDENVWRPYELNVEHIFPDVYLLTDPKEETPTPNRVFKSFIFYSDTMNVREPSADIVRATASWDNDMNEYEYDKAGAYRNIFMEKFYWMAVRTIYKGLMVTKYRWECIEYIQDNASYDRFNALFLNTIEPYVKMGESTYLKSDHFGFVIDDRIDKLNEYMKSIFLGYNRVTGFEMYLNKSWSPSYFDTRYQIDSTFDTTSRLIRRPRSTFDTRRVLRVLNDSNLQIIAAARILKDTITNIINDIKYSGLKYQLNLLYELNDLTDEMLINITNCIQFIDDLDMDIYDIEDVNTIVGFIERHFELVDLIEEKFSGIHATIGNPEDFDAKLIILRKISELIRVDLHDIVFTLGDYIQLFDMETFMRGVNNPAFFDEYYHDDDSSLIGAINNFNTAWPNRVQKARNDLYVSSAALWAFYNPDKSYKQSEVDQMLQMAYTVRSHINSLYDAVFSCWDDESEYDPNIVAKFDFAKESMATLIDSLEHIIALRNRLFSIFDEIRAKILEVSALGIDEYEESLALTIDTAFDRILEHLSYIAGANRKTDALEEYQNTLIAIEQWIEYVDRAKDIYMRLSSVTGKPNVFLDSIDLWDKYLKALLKYLKSIDRIFIPDIQSPTYSSVYQISKVELVNNGFNHQLGDEVYIPRLGVYSVSDVDGEINECMAITAKDCRNTTFRDPTWSSLEYDGITSGIGLGITVNAVESVETKIFNDTEVLSYIERARNIIQMVTSDMYSINPFNNYITEKVSSRLKRIQDDWNDLLSFYNEYMSDEIVSKADEIIESLSCLISPMERLNDARTLNDVKGLLGMVTNFLDRCETIFASNNLRTPNYLYFLNRVNVYYGELTDYYGNGTTWNDESQLKNIMDNMEYELKLFNRKMVSLLPNDTEIPSLYTGVINKINALRNALDIIPTTYEDIQNAVSGVEVLIENMPEPIRVDKWYRITKVSVAEAGRNYQVGDIVEMIPALPTDVYGNEIHDDEDTIMNDRLFFRVLQTTEAGECLRIEPIIDYALPYSILGFRETAAATGTGEFLSIMVVSKLIDHNDSTLFLTDDSYIAPVNQFDDNDMLQFKFPNIYDLPVAYAVMFNGAERHDVVIRHEHEPDPGDTDVIYLNANDVLRLNDSSVFTEGENYFIFKLTGMNISDPGAGYYEGQVITVDAGQTALKLQVSEVEGFEKGIKSIEFIQNYQLFNGVNPSSDHAEVVNDSINNIDDEFNSGYYDNIPAEGIVKSSTKPYSAEEYPFVSRRFENTISVDRNTVWMYSDIPFPEGYQDMMNGDPDDHQYLGTRIDNSYIGIESDPWNGISETVPVTDPFIPDTDRIPLNQPVRGEYQLIDMLRIHTLDTQMMDRIPDQSLDNVLNRSIVDEPAEGTFITRYGDEYEAIDKESIPNPDAYGNDVVIVDNDIIKAIDISRISELIRNQAVGIQNPGPYFNNLVPTSIPYTDEGYYYSTKVKITGDKTVPNYVSLPKHINEWKGICVGQTAIVEKDETMGNHRTAYRVRTFIISGYIVYDKPIVVDYEWTSFNIKWDGIDSYPDLPVWIEQYPDDIWNTADGFIDVQRKISDGNITRVITPNAHAGTFITDLTPDDLSVYNFTEKHWEDLHDESRWALIVTDTGFELKFVPDGMYSANMMLFLNKTPATQIKNAALKRNAVFNITAEIFDSVNTKSRNTNVNTGKTLTFRKMFPYEQKEEYVLDGTRKDHTMEFTLAPYMHFKNDIQVCDIQVFNLSANRFEDALDTSMFEIQIKDDKAYSTGYETQTKIKQVIIGDAGSGFSNGEAWAWNAEYEVHVFGHIETDVFGDGKILKFIPDHFVNAPTNHVALEFKIYQTSMIYDSAVAIAIIEFDTERVQVAGDGWLHNVTNPYAPIKSAFKVIIQYDVDDLLHYQLIINKNPQTWKFLKNEWEIFPTFTLPNVHIPQDHLYITTDEGRLPLINPSTGKPSFIVSYTDNDTNVQYLNMYHKYEHLEIHSTPYQMRSVFIKRRVPASGYVDVSGRINKPLNKKYFEFWMNGRLLNDEVTIISPTKLFLHGLKSLRNFEIIEINRDPNEYFSDAFLSTSSKNGIPYPIWNYDTYLDDSLSGTLDYDNYNLTEQAALLTPVWPQVDISNDEYRNYPENMDSENDILSRTDSSMDLSAIGSTPPYQFSVVDVPTIEGIPIYSRGITFEQFGFRPITEQMIIDMLNEEWKDEIEEGLISNHTIISDEDWYGIVARMYDEEGNLVHSLEDAAYKVTNDQLVAVNTNTKISHIMQNPMTYNLD